MKLNPKLMTGIGPTAMLCAGMSGIVRICFPGLFYTGTNVALVVLCGALIGGGAASVMAPVTLELKMWHVSWIERRGKITKKFRKEQTENLVRGYVDKNNCDPKVPLPP